MTSLAKGEVSSVSNPRLWIACQAEGRLTDPYELSFSIFDRTSNAKKLSPELIAGPTAVDLVAHRLGLGRFVAAYTVPDVVGLHRIRWTWKMEETGATYSADQDFEVLDGVAFDPPVYALVSDMREEGVTGDAASDIRVQSALAIASRMIDKITGRFFAPVYATQKFDGRNGRKLTMWDPIIALEELSIESELVDPPGTDVTLSDVRVFNRHISQNLRNPDDRESPKIEFVQISWPYDKGRRPAGELRFPEGVQNVAVTGLFGYTEYDGSGVGKTPDLIRHVTKLMAARELPRLTETGCRSDARDQWRVTEERTRDQAVKYAAPLKLGQMTGDPEIDQILVVFMRPPDLGAI